MPSKGNAVIQESSLLILNKTTSKRSHKAAHKAARKSTHKAAHKAKSDGRVLTKVIGIVSLLSLLLAYSAWSYSVVARQVADLNKESVKAEYTGMVVSKSPAQLEECKKRIKEYNRELAITQIRDPFMFYKHDVPENYKRLQDFIGTPVMGQLSVPSVNIDEPIYYSRGGRSPGKNIEHVVSTSIPDDAPGTNAVLAGHSGQVTSVAFDLLEGVKNDDVIYVQLLNRQFTYRVTSVDTVDVDHVEVLKTKDGISQITLLTCWPRYLNTKRLIVRGTLVSSTVLVANNDNPNKAVYKPMYIIVLLALLLLTGGLLYAIRQLVSVKRSNRKTVLRVVVPYLIIMCFLWLFTLWVLWGLLLGNGLVASPDIGYSWFNAHIFRLFAT